MDLIASSKVKTTEKKELGYNISGVEGRVRAPRWD
jgi:hypothetical protein